MKTIEFISAGGQDEVAVPDVGLIFNRNTTEGLTARIKTVTDETAAILLTNPNFKEVDAHAAPHIAASTPSPSVSAAPIHPAGGT